MIRADCARRLPPCRSGPAHRACLDHACRVNAPEALTRSTSFEAPLTVPHLDAAVSLLHALSGPHGIHASQSGTANYRAIFSRDGVMAGIAGLLLGDATITAGFVRTLEALRDTQGAEGQVASNFEPRDGQAPSVSFGSLAPRIDGATWYLVGVALAARRGAINPDEYEASVRAAVHVLNALEYNGRHLLYVPTGGNWADEYIYDGYILYDQVLRGWALRLLGVTYEQDAWVQKAAQIAHRIDESYWPDARRTACHPIASFSPVTRRDIFDLAACSLLALSDLAPAMSAAALDWICAEFLDAGELPPAFHPVIDESHPDWPALRRYHLHEFRNRPFEYHNGGVWPIWLGWLALAFAHTGRDAALQQLRALVSARLASLPDYGFEEYFHGATGESLGTPQMAYSATGLIFLDHATEPDTCALFTT